MNPPPANSSPPIFGWLLEDDLDALRAGLERDPAAASARCADGLSTVLTALYHRKRAALELILRASPELDVFDAAALGRDSRLTELLDASPTRANAFAPDGNGPLHLAAYFRHASTVDLLLSRGAEVDAEARNPSRVRPLHSACAGRDLAIVERIVAAGASVDAPQHGGFTPLHAAAMHGDEGIARVLLAAGASPHVTADDGRTAKDFAASGDHPALLAILGS